VQLQVLVLSLPSEHRAQLLLSAAIVDEDRGTGRQAMTECFQRGPARPRQAGWRTVHEHNIDARWQVGDLGCVVPIHPLTSEGLRRERGPDDFAHVGQASGLDLLADPCGVGTIVLECEQAAAAVAPQEACGQQRGCARPALHDDIRQISQLDCNQTSEVWLDRPTAQRLRR
jgi:hypothetical protein